MDLLVLKKFQGIILNWVKNKGLKITLKKNLMHLVNSFGEERKKQYDEALKLKTKYVFFDRALHDVIGYLNYVQDPNKKWEKELNNYKYNLVFLLKPVFQIYIQDEDRMETFEEAVEVHKSLEKTYHQSKLKIIKLPFTTPQKRFDLILKHCANELS